MRRTSLGVALLAAVACAPDERGEDAEPWAWQLPPHLPAPIVPDGNPMSAAKVELGRHLFHETRLSLDGNVSCGTCHVQALAFTDAEATSIGADGQRGTRSAMSLANVAYMPTLTWGNPLLESLEAHALVPLFADLPLEMGAQYVIDDALDAFATDDAWADRFTAAFPTGDPFTIANVAAALASFQRALVSVDSPYDRWRLGDTTALGPAELRGMALFRSERLGCTNCHDSVLQSSTLRSEDAPDAVSRFENTGLHDLGEVGGYPLPNIGLAEFTHDPADVGRHRVPSLRNVAVTAPYMHDGSIADLDGVIDHYAAGGRTVNPNKSPLLRSFRLDPPERADLVAFLHALTDEEFLTDPRFADPNE